MKVGFWLAIACSYGIAWADMLFNPMSPESGVILVGTAAGLVSTKVATTAVKMTASMAAQSFCLSCLVVFGNGHCSTGSLDFLA